MTHTTNFNLTQWSKSDRIQMADFNADNQKIDAALAAVSACNCRYYCATYTGDGALTRTFTFPAKPVMVHIISDTAFTVLNRGLNVGATFWNATAHYEVAAEWGENSVTISNSISAACIANNEDWSFGLFAILEAN